MKKLFAILLVIVLTSCGAALEPPKSNTDYNNIIGKPIKIGNLEIAQYDFPEQINWEDAKIFCTNLGKGWRLPTIEELNYLHKNRRTSGSFTGNVYWSSTEEAYSTSRGTAFSQNEFSQASITWNPYYVRAVRALEQSESEKNMIRKNIMGKSIKIGNIEVAQYDFPKIMNWEDAKKACADLGEGWKLPSKDELKYLYQNRVAIGGFAPGVYWSSTEGGSFNAWFQDFGSGDLYDAGKYESVHVRAIRSF